MKPKYKRVCPYCGETCEGYVGNSLICKCGAKYYYTTQTWLERKNPKEKNTPDLVKVVRCQDCKWWTKQKDSVQGRCGMYGRYPTGAWYCANGERREE